MVAAAGGGTFSFAFRQVIGLDFATPSADPTGMRKRADLQADEVT